VNSWKYVGVHDAVDLVGVGGVVRGVPFTTDLDLSGREDFEPVATPSKRNTKKES
jgi:hypothetical protein